MKQEFHVGDMVVYKGDNTDIGYGATGVVIAAREATLSMCPFAVRYDKPRRRLFNINGLDPTNSSIWCHADNLILDEEAYDCKFDNAVDIAALF